MTEKNDGGSAFPLPGMTGLPNGEFIHGVHGMTLRDYFAAKHMQALSSTEFYTEGRLMPDEVAQPAYEMADAMLKARES